MVDRTATQRPRVVLLRGLSVAPWDLRPHELLSGDYDVSVLVGRRNLYGTANLALDQRAVRSVSSFFPRGPIAELATRAVGERFVGLAKHLRGADIVHAAELGNWYSAQAADLKRRYGYQLVITAWETLPLLSAYRNVRTRPYAQRVLASADRFIACTERARAALLLEGVPADQIVVAPPGIDLKSFASGGNPPADGKHLILSVGRLVWEKGHQDLLRALALLRARGRDDVRVVIVGDGPERGRLREVIDDLALDAVVEVRASVPYDEMPALYAQASCFVLASLPVRFWEEQFGMVLAEAMAGRLEIIASTSGAIPEVVGPSGTYVAAGDWVGLAAALERGPLARAPGVRRPVASAELDRYSTAAAAERLRAVYAEVLAAGKRA